MREATPNPQDHTRPAADDASVPFEQAKRLDGRGDHWYARDLMPLFGFRSWQRFKDAVDRAAAACAITDGDPAAEFVPAPGARPDYRLTRRAAGLIAMSGDARDPLIAAAQAYFAPKAPEPDAVESLDEIEVARKYLAALEAKRDLQSKVADLAPSAASWEVLASGRGDFSVSDAAKILSRDPSIQIGQNRLFGTLGALSWAYRQQGDHSWRAYQSAVNAGWLSELPQSHSHPRSGKRVLDPPQLRVTAKGLGELRRRLGGDRDAPIAGVNPPRPEPEGTLNRPEEAPNADLPRREPGRALGRTLESR
ncbi:phage antirepressor KilAC domain-containing protein [Glycomyces sp. A-F 0318]|uniref:phage antirepressor KilAC domain-containing protein n=1 Tax=Glycomyces amatae TaxID=2881355 RepID=UPI001E5CA7E1|nr:phage antirepressor KilAC domain-containing protein [Glycomyces amatae]MCD0444063.1 phage antirepressor KilAC domain-containing protein [Glycomyces amatae]